MKKLNVIGLFLLAGLEIQAMPLTAPLLNKILPPADTTVRETCADFSGHWKGVCTTEGQSPKAEYSIIQQTGCDLIVSNSQPIFVGGTTDASHAFTMAGKNYTSGYTLAADWNDDKSKISFQVLANARAMQKSGLFPIYLNGDMAIKNGQLKVNLKMFDTKGECTYDKF